MAARKRVSTEGLSDGWLLDSSGALYDVRFRASTTRVMNAGKLLEQLLFVDRNPLVFFYERHPAEGPMLPEHRLPVPTGVFATGPDALTLFHRLYLDFFPALAGKEPHYPTERLAPPDRFVVSTGFAYEHGGDANTIRFKPGDRIEFISGDVSMDILARTPASEKKAQSLFVDAALREFMPDAIALLSVGARGPALEAFFVGHFEARTPQIYTEWNRRRRGFASGRRRT